MSVAEPYFGGRAPDRVVPIRAAGLGAAFGGGMVEMTARRCMAYAAGIGSTGPLHLDDTRPGGLVVVPAITCALEWPQFTGADWLAAVGRDRDTIFNHLVHGSQVTDFHRPIRVGERLRTAGRIVAMRQTRAGALVTARLETTAADGEPIATGWFGALYRDTPLDGPGGEIEPPPTLRPEAEVPGGAARLPLPIPPGQAHVYTECAGIWNPIHTERAFALASGLPDIILHGTCSWAMALQALAALHRPDDPRPFRRFGARFSGYVVPGQTAVLEHGPPGADGAVPFALRTATGRLALSHGLAVPA